MIVFEGLLFCVFVGFCVWQLVIPAAFNRPLLPLLRREKPDPLKRARQHREQAEHRRRVALEEAEALRIESEADKITEEALEKLMEDDHDSTKTKER